MSGFLLFLNRGIRNLFYALFFLIPLVLYPKTFELFEFNKLWVTFSISIIILFFWVAKMIVLKKIIFKKTPFDIPIILFLISQIISTIFSIDPHVSVWGYYSRFNGGLFSLLSYVFLYYAFISNFPYKNDGKENEVLYDETGKINTRYFIFGLISIVVFSILVSFSQSVSFLQDLFLLGTFLAPCIFFIRSFDFPPIKKLFLMILTGGTIVGLWGFSSHFGYDFSCLLFRGTLNVSCWTDAFQPTIRLFSTLGQPNWLAAYFSVLIPISMAVGIYKMRLYFESGGKISFNSRFLKTTIYLLLSVLFFVEVLWTQSVSGYLGLLSGLFIFVMVLLLFLAFKRKPSNIIKNSTFRLFVVFAALFFAASFFLGNPLQERFSALSLSGIKHMITPSAPPITKIAPEPVTQELGGSDSGKIRLVVWQGAIELFKRNPIFGTGVETFAYAYYNVKPKTHNLFSEWDFLYNKAHNEYLNYLATTGIFGLGTYLLMIGWFCFYAIQWLIKRFDPLELRSLLVLALFSSYVSILVSNFFGFSVVIINIFLFFIPGLTFCIINSRVQPDEEHAEMSPIKSVGLIIFGLFCLYLQLHLLNYWFADQNYSMGYNLNRAQEYVQANKYLEDAVSLYPAEDLYKSELSLNLATLALLLNQQNRATDSAIFVDRAKNLSDQVIARHPKNLVFYKTRVQALFELSEIDKKYYQEAINTLKKARILAPTDAKLAYNEGLLYGQKGDLENAIRALQESIDLKPNYKESRYAIAVYQSQLSKKITNTIQKQKLLNEAKDNLNFLLKNIVPKDQQTIELLKSIE